MAEWRFLVYISCFLLFWIYGINCQEYVVPVYVRADQYGTDHFEIPKPKFGPHKSSFHIEQLIKLENELLGLGGLILETEAKLHARKKLQKVEDEKKKTDAFKDGSAKHDHNYTRETRFMEEINEKNEDAIKNAHSYVTNPLAMFPIRKRLAESWPYIMDNITECTMVSDHVAISDHFQNINRKLQNDGDLDMAYEDLLRLQKTYSIPVSSLARGWLLDEVTDPLSLQDIIAIANICLNREDLKGALEWLLQVAKFLKTMKLQGKLKAKYMHILGGAYLRLNRLQEAKLVYGQLLKEDADNRIANANMKLIEEKMKYEAAMEQKAKDSVDEPKKKTKKGKSSRGKSDEKKDKKDGYKEEWWVKHCRGDLPPLYERETMLKSYVKEIPISGKKYKITPLSIHPPMYLIKDVLEEFTINKLIEVTTEEIVDKIHSYSQPDEASAPVYADEENYWMEKFVYTVRNLTYQKYNVDSHTRLNILGAVRVYNVGAGGTSNPGRGEMRITARSTWEKNFIGRYVTFLNTPKAGGDFVFPWLRVRVKPQKGDVLFWQFRTTTGLVNPKVFHWLECPVLLGELWYAEQMMEHHRMIEKVDFDFKELPVKPQDAKKKKLLKKKKKLIKEEDEEEEGLDEETPEDEDEAAYEDGEEIVSDEEEAEPEEQEEEVVVPKKKVVKKAKVKAKEKESKEKHPKAKTVASKDKHPKEAKAKDVKTKESKTKEASKEKPTKEKSEKPAAKTPPPKKKKLIKKKKVVKK